MVRRTVVKKMIIFGMSAMLMGSILTCAGCSAGKDILKNVGNTIQEKRVSDKEYTDLGGEDKTYYWQKVINDRDAESIYALFSEEVKGQVGESELKEQIQSWLNLFDENVSLEYGGYSESNDTDSDEYSDEEDVIFYYTIDGVKYQCEVGSVRASEVSDDYVGVRYMLIVKSELFDSGEYSCKGFDTNGITVVDY